MNTSHMQMQPLVVPSGTGPFLELGDHRGHVLVSARSTGGAFALALMSADPDGNVPLHVHRREDETFHILEGRFALLVGGKAIEAGPGDTVFAPRDLPHTWRCISPEGGKAMVLITPGDNFEAFGIEMARQGFVPSAAMADLGARVAFMALTDRYGIEMLLPIK